MNTLASLDSKINNPQQLMTGLSTIRGTCPIVTTNGCFDVLHVGHLSLLAYAANLSPYTIVLLNSDRSIKHLKGPTRPINACDQRAYMLAALTFVWRVIVFDELEPTRLLSEIKPDFHVKSDDYKTKNIPEAALLKRIGGKMRFAPRLEPWSTTKILHQLAKNLPTSN